MSVNLNKIDFTLLLISPHFKGWDTVQGHSQLAHMRIRYHFIAYLHLAESRSILFLTNKNNIERAEAHSKTGFFSVND